MFETQKNQEFVMPKGLGPDDLRLWKTMQLSLNQPWFFVVYTQRSQSGEKVKGGIFLSDYKQLIMLAEDKGNNLESIMIASPSYINQSDAWQFDELIEVWEGVEFECEQTGVVYVLKDGARFSDSLEKEEKTLLNLKRLYPVH